MSRRPVLFAHLFLLLGAAPCFAQTFGVKAGLVSSTLKLSGTGADEAKSFIKRRTGIAGGGFLGVGKGVIGLQLEALYTDKGVKVAGDFQGTPFELELHTTYVEVPALLRVGMPSGKFRPYIYAGPAAAFEIKCEGKSEGTTGACEDAEQQADSERRKLDFTAVGGAGIQVAMGRLALPFEVRYARGIRPLNESGDLDAKNEALSFLGGIAFQLGGNP